MTQEHALTILKLGHTAFLTGAAGSGKSHTLREYITYLQDHSIPHAVTASTGIASTHIHGQTIHSWSGIGIKEHIAHHDCELLEQKEALFNRWNSASVLIIDEISMLSGTFLNSLNTVAQHMRRNKKPFGGIQVVFCGDFFQLPPVQKHGDGKLAFEVDAWREAKPVILYLHEQHRQKNNTLTTILNTIRTNTVSEITWESLKTTLRNSESVHTKLYTHNTDVDAINQREYEKLKGKEQIYDMKTRGKGAILASLKQNCLALEELRLKVGTKVIFIKNDIAKKYMNGTTGVVTGFDTRNMPIVKTNTEKIIHVEEESWKIEEDGKVKAEIQQLPLRLAWAITIHKSQGMTLDAAEIDLSKSFTYGMGYVALSRLTALDGLHLRGIHENALLMHPTVIKADAIFQKKSTDAEEAIKKYTDTEIIKLHKEWIVRAGGSTEKREPERESDELRDTDVSTYDKTKEYLLKQTPLAEIATLRSLTEGTIVSHIQKLYKEDTNLSIEYLLPSKKDRDIILSAFDTHKTLTAVYEDLKKKYDYTTLKLVRLIKN